MSTAILNRAGSITLGWKMYHRAACIHWPDSGKREIGRCVTDLYTALDMYGRVAGAQWPDVVSGLLGKWATRASDACESLVKTVRFYCGDADADYVRNGGAA